MKRGSLAIVMEFIGRWSMIELQITHAVTFMARSDFRTIAAMLDSLRGGRWDAVTAAIVVNRPNDLTVFESAWKYLGTLKKRRDMFAHGVLVKHVSNEDAVAVIRQKDMSAALAGLVEAGVLSMRPQGTRGLEPFSFANEHVMLFTKDDMDEHLRCMAAGRLISLAVFGLLSGDEEVADRARRQLSQD